MAKKTVRVFLLSRRVALAVGAVLAAAAIFGAVHIPAAVSAAGTARAAADIQRGKAVGGGGEILRYFL